MFTRDRSPLPGSAALLAPIAVADGVAVARVASGSLTHRHTASLDAEATAALAEADVLVLDLSDVGYIDSAGLGGLVRAVKTARDGGRDVVLASLQRDVRVLVEMMRLHELIDIVNTPDEAIREHHAASLPAADQAAAIDVKESGIDVGELVEAGLMPEPAVAELDLETLR